MTKTPEHGFRRGPFAAFEIESLNISQWCPDDKAQVPPTQVHIEVHVKGLKAPLAMRFKGPDTLGALIQQMTRHRREVWPQAKPVPADPGPAPTAASPLRWRIPPGFIHFYSHFRPDGWPLCPCCDEDGLLSKVLWDGKSEQPLPLEAYIGAGMQCRKCEWNFRHDGWPLCPRCGEDNLLSALSKGENLSLQEYLYAGIRCTWCHWEFKSLLQPLPRAGRKITDVLCQCPGCGWAGTVGDCEPDVDGDGSLGCPRCNQVVTIRL